MEDFVCHAHVFSSRMLRIDPSTSEKHDVVNASSYYNCLTDLSSRGRARSIAEDSRLPRHSLVGRCHWSVYDRTRLTDGALNTDATRGGTETASPVEGGPRVAGTLLRTGARLEALFWS